MTPDKVSQGHSRSLGLTLNWSGVDLFTFEGVLIYFNSSVNIGKPVTVFLEYILILHPNEILRPFLEHAVIH